MLLITDPDVKQVLRVEDIIDDMERAFAEEARGVAVNKPRTRYKVPPDRDSDGYMANIIPGAVPSSGRGGAPLRLHGGPGADGGGSQAHGLPVPRAPELGFRPAVQP